MFDSNYRLPRSTSAEGFKDLNSHIKKSVGGKKIYSVHTISVPCVSSENGRHNVKIVIDHRGDIVHMDAECPMDEEYLDTLHRLNVEAVCSFQLRAFLLSVKNERNWNRYNQGTFEDIEDPVLRLILRSSRERIDYIHKTRESNKLLCEGKRNPLFSFLNNHLKKKSKNLACLIYLSYNSGTNKLEIASDYGSVATYEEFKDKGFWMIKPKADLSYMFTRRDDCYCSGEPRTYANLEQHLTTTKHIKNCNKRLIEILNPLPVRGVLKHLKENQ